MVMVAAVKQLVTVEEDGRLELHSPELRRGTIAEVIVLIPEEGPRTCEQSLAALESLQHSMALTPSAADEWINQVRAERDAWRPALPCLE
jgi:hypothetical protein